MYSKKYSLINNNKLRPVSLKSNNTYYFNIKLFNGLDKIWETK